MLLASLSFINLRMTFSLFTSAVETVPSVIEALAVLDVLEDIPGSRCWISFQCKEGGATTARGEPIEEAFTALAAHPGFRLEIYLLFNLPPQRILIH